MSNSEKEGGLAMTDPGIFTVTYRSLGAVVEEARATAYRAQAAQVIAVAVDKNVPTFHVLHAESYLTLVERGTAPDLAHVGTVGTDLVLRFAPAFRPWNG